MGEPQLRFQLSNSDSEILFEQIASDIYHKGYSIQPNALPLKLADDLCHQVRQLPSASFKRAGVGRKQHLLLNDFVRTDEVRWISSDCAIERSWLSWSKALQLHLNRRLFLGLYSFESHFAHYKPGDYYKRHLDAFKGQANRVLSLVTYLNPMWLPDQGGELVLYHNQLDQEGIRITPQLGTIAVFLSEEFPHEVLPAGADRYSIAGWFRVNSSTTALADPPQ